MNQETLNLIGRKHSVEDIKKVVELFIKAAERAKKANFDCVQLHAAHFFFLSRFISPSKNHRTDEYGGSIENRVRILCDIIKGRGNYSAEWMLVIQKSEDIRWVLKPINVVLKHYSEGNVFITKRGSLRIGQVLVQRKGGDGGRKTAQMLQFKVNPAELFDD